MKHSQDNSPPTGQRPWILTRLSGSLISAMMLVTFNASASLDVIVSDYQVDFDIGIVNDGAVLTVSGDDYVWRHSFTAGELVSLSVYDSDGSTLADGVNHWQLEVIPDTDVAANLAIASTLENQGEGEAIPWPAQTGAVAIANGAFVSPDVSEPGESGNVDQQSTQVFGDGDAEQEDSDD